MPVLETVATVIGIGTALKNLFGGDGDDSASIKAHDDALDAELKRGLDLTRQAMQEVYPPEIVNQKYNDITNTSYSFWNSKNYSQAKARIENAYNETLSYAKQSGGSSTGGTTLGTQFNVNKIIEWLPMIGLAVLGFIAIKSKG